MYWFDEYRWHDGKLEELIKNKERQILAHPEQSMLNAPTLQAIVWVLQEEFKLIYNVLAELRDSSEGKASNSIDNVNKNIQQLEEKINNKINELEQDIASVM